MSLIIRSVSEKDTQAVLDIYAWYVENTAITFEYDVPSAEEFAGRIRNILKKYPYLAAVQDGVIVGYAYAGTFKDRAAYDWAVETTIYLRHDLQHAGIGRVLYTALEDALRRQGILNLYACIGYPKQDDEYLTSNSADFHAHLGYRMVGRFIDCGYKFGRWYDMVWMEKMLGDHISPQPPVIPYSTVSE